MAPHLRLPECACYPSGMLPKCCGTQRLVAILFYTRHAHADQARARPGPDQASPGMQPCTPALHSCTPAPAPLPPCTYTPTPLHPCPCTPPYTPAPAPLPLHPCTPALVLLVNSHPSTHLVPYATHIWWPANRSNSSACLPFPAVQAQTLNSAGSAGVAEGRPWEGRRGHVRGVEAMCRVWRPCAGAAREGYGEGHTEEIASPRHGAHTAAGCTGGTVPEWHRTRPFCVPEGHRTRLVCV